LSPIGSDTDAFRPALVYVYVVVPPLAAVCEVIRPITLAYPYVVVFPSGSAVAAS
jgi:hypothetical protein